MLQRYKELGEKRPSGDAPPEPVPYDLKGYLTEIDTGLIDIKYMNENFTKWLKAIEQGNVSAEELEALSQNLHRSFASLSQEDQGFAQFFINDIQSGDITLEPGMTLRDYITRYAQQAKNKQVSDLVDAIGVNQSKLEELLRLNLSENNINDFGRFDALVATVDKTKAKTYFEKCEGQSLPLYKVNIKIYRLLRQFLLAGGIDILVPYHASLDEE